MGLHAIVEKKHCAFFGRKQHLRNVLELFEKSLGRVGTCSSAEGFWQDFSKWQKITPTLIYDRMRLKVLRGFIPKYR